MQNNSQNREEAMRSSALSVTKSFQPQSEEQVNLRVLIDARKLRDGGIGVYTRNLVSGLLQTGNATLTLLTKPGESLPEEWDNKVIQIEDKAKNYSFDELFGIAKRIDFSQIDLFHTPHYMLPYRIPVPSIITVHDLIHISHPEKSYYPALASQLIRSSLKRASRILTVSESSRREIVAFSRSREKITSKVRVIPNAIDPFFIEQGQKKLTVTTFKNRSYGKYFIALFSNLKPHKGLMDLLHAFEVARERSGSDLKLVLVGQGTENITAAEKILEKASSMQGVHVIGRVRREELAELYSKAQALIVPSLAEGFSLPVVEAQALGTPVIARPVPAICEIMSARDIMSADFSVEALTQSILKLIQRNTANKEPQEVESEQQIFQDHLKRFNQLDLAKTILQVYQEALAGSK